jgi:hypothetical protein
MLRNFLSEFIILEIESNLLDKVVYGPKVVKIDAFSERVGRCSALAQHECPQ